MTEESSAGTAVTVTFAAVASWPAIPSNSDYEFAQMTVVLPRLDAALMRFLLQYYAAGFRTQDARMVQ